MAGVSRLVSRSLPRDDLDGWRVTITVTITVTILIWR
jgi:hypothetical protein